MPQQRKPPLLLSAEALIKSAQSVNGRLDEFGTNLAFQLKKNLIITEE